MTGSDRLAEICGLFEGDDGDTYLGHLTSEHVEWLVAALVAERALSDALVQAIQEGCHVDVLGEEMVAAAFKEHRRLRGLPEED